MKELLRAYPFFFLFLLSCAGQGSGILVQFDSTKPLDQSQLERHCDMEDSTACLLLGKPSEKLQRVPLLQGIAPAGRAIFAVLLSQDRKISWYSREPDSLKLKPLQIYQAQTRPQSTYRVEQIQASELVAGKTYELLGVDQLGQLVDHRTFETLSPGENFRFALISGSDDHSAQADLWADLALQHPQLIIGLGNNVYATSRGAEVLGTSVSAGELWERHCETRAKLPIFLQEHLVPYVATWNDRDFGMLNGNKSYPHADESRRIMETFFPYVVDAKTVLEGPGISHGLRIAGQTFLLLDNRSFRTPRRAEEPAYFGRIQESWALGLISSHEGPLWLLSGEKWFGKKGESFEAAEPGAFVNFLAKLSQALKKNAKNPAFPVFASGAQSRTEIRKVPSFSTYEFSSGFQSPASPEKKRDAQTLIAANGGYMILDATKSELKAQIRSSGGVLAEKTINLQKRKR